MTKLAPLFILLIIGVASATATANDKGIVGKVSHKSWGESNVNRYLSPPTVPELWLAEEYVEIEAIVSAYNTVPEQTDGDPCISSSGDNICGRDDVMACPRSYTLSQEVEMDGKRYICLDRMNWRYERETTPHFDISFDKDIASAINFGRQRKIIKIIK